MVGAGFSGLAMGLELKRHLPDRAFAIFEAEAALGGTWRDNTYPGCACDVPSHLYSLRAAPEPRWSRIYGQQAEIRAYMERVADDHDLRRHIRFQTPITALAFDAARGWWTLTTAQGAVTTARAVVLGVGPLSHPSIPRRPGQEAFQGPQFHSVRWDHGVPLQGRRVAVVGTGASAVQIVPALAPQVAHLDLYQRTPPWVMARNDRSFAAWEQALLAHVPGVRRAYRARMFWWRELLATGFIQDGALKRVMAWRVQRHLEQSVPDPVLRAKLTPRYALGCKRVLLSDDYYPALQRDNVTVIAAPVERLTPTGVVAAGAERPADVIVYATGFQPAAPLAILSVEAGGRALRDVWADGVEAHYGITVAGFPNLYLLIGPNTGLGHSSMILMIEAQARYARQCIDQLLRHNLRALDVLPEVQRASNDRLQERLVGTVWNSGCQSWYLDDSGTTTALWPSYVWEYQLRTRRPNLRHFRAIP